MHLETSPESNRGNKSEKNLRNLQDDIVLSPNLPPLPPPADSSSELDDSILAEVLAFYPERSPTNTNQSPSSVRVQSEWLEKLQSRFDEIIAILIPTPEALNERLIVLDYVRTIIHRSLGAHVYPMGSFTTKTFLPGGDVDISAFLTTDQVDSWFVRVNEAMCLSSIGNETNATGYTLPDGSFKRVTIRNVSFINAWVKVVKGIVNNIEVDISANQIGALYAQALIERVDDFIQKSHLFKRSIFLIKAWCKYESTKYNSYEGGVFGAREGRLSTWSILIMIIWIFNKYGREISHPFQVLTGFICYFANFDWTKYALTVHGPVSVEDLKPLPMSSGPGSAGAGSGPGSGGPGSGTCINEFYLLPLCGGYIPNEILNQYRDRFNSTRDSSINRRKEKYMNLNRHNNSHSNSTTPTLSGGGVPLSVSQENDDNTSVQSELSRHSDDPGGHSDFEDETGKSSGLISYSYYKRGLMNVIDPIQVKHNTTRAVDMTGYRAIMESLSNGKKALVKLCSDMKSYTTDPVKYATTTASLTTSPSLSSSPSRAASSIILNSPIFQDVPLIRRYLENTITKFLEMRHPPVINSLPSSASSAAPGSDDYGILKSSSQQIELSLKYAELIVGSVVTPEALAKLIVTILENKGPLPVGEIGKQLQEMTGNENLSNVLRANYRGLKKVVEGFHEIFLVGTEHPFNPLVHLHENYVRIRNECWYDDSRFVHLFTFTPGDLSGGGGGGGGGMSPRTYRGRDYSGGGFPEISTVASYDSYERNDHFLGLTKSRSFKEQHGVNYERGDVKRSGSLSSAPIGIATGMLLSPNSIGNSMMASSPGGRGRNKNKNNANNNNSSVASSPGNQNNPLLTTVSQPPRHSKQSQQQQQQQQSQAATAASNGASSAPLTAAQQQQQQQYLQQQQQYYQQQYQQQIQYQTYLHQQQYFYTQQQMAMLQQQQQSKESATGESGVDSDTTPSSSTVLDDPSGSSSNSPPAVPQLQLPQQFQLGHPVPVPGQQGGFMMYPMPIPIPFPNKSNPPHTGSGGGNDAPNSPSQSSLSSSPNAAPNPYMHGVQGGPLPLGFFPHLFNPLAASPASASGIPTSGSSNQHPSSISPVPGGFPPRSSSSPTPSGSSLGHQASMPVLIPPMMKPPPYGMFYGSPLNQYSLSPQSVGSYMAPSSLQPSNPTSSSSAPPLPPAAATGAPTASSSGGGSSVPSSPPSLPPRGHTS
jgi:hypothetical protein